MSDRKWGFFPFDTLDYKAAQAYLDKKTEDGWVLDHIYLGYLARFVPAEGRYHCIDLDLPHVFDDDLNWDYVEFCEDAGWELVKNQHNMLIFRSKLGQHPAPLQTDKSMEAERFWKKHMRRNLLFTLFFLFFYGAMLILAFSIGNEVFPFRRYIGKNSSLLPPLFLLFLSAELVRLVVRSVRVYISFRRKGALPEQQPSGPWFFGILTLVIAALTIGWWCLDLAEDLGLGKTVDVGWSHYGDEYTATPELCQSYPVITAADLGLPYSEDSRYLDGRRSVLVDFLDYSEIADGEEGATHVLTTERYECANELVARWLFSSRRSETLHGTNFTWGELEWGEVTTDYGFDRICFARDDSYLLAQEGDTVILVGASDMDLTEHFDTIRQRLELED